MGIKTVTHATLGNVVILAFLVGKIKITKLLARRKGAKSVAAFSSRLTGRLGALVAGFMWWGL